LILLAVTQGLPMRLAKLALGLVGFVACAAAALYLLSNRDAFYVLIFGALGFGIIGSLTAGFALLVKRFRRLARQQN
jgi:hypothetical protein